MEDLTINGITVSKDAINTLVVMAAREVEGVVCGAEGGAAALIGKLTAAEDLSCDIAQDGDKLRLGVHIQVEYGKPLPEIANNVRDAVANSVSTQLGLEVSSVDVYIDGIQFE